VAVQGDVEVPVCAHQDGHGVHWSDSMVGDGDEADQRLTSMCRSACWEVRVGSCYGITGCTDLSNTRLRNASFRSRHEGSGNAKSTTSRSYGLTRTMRNAGRSSSCMGGGASCLGGIAVYLRPVPHIVSKGLSCRGSQIQRLPGAWFFLNGEMRR
jgi:hypothetical protein